MGSSHEVGSSPRVRGKHAGRPGARALHRLIPACAGKTATAVWTGVQAAAHPRVCGENVAGSQQIAAAQGSSPRVRGKPHPHNERTTYNGLIPACAGKT